MRRLAFVLVMVVTACTSSSRDRPISHSVVATYHAESTAAVYRDGELQAALGSFGSSMIENELEMLVDATDYAMTGDAIASGQRFGTFPVDLTTGVVDTTKNWLDPRIAMPMVDELATRGLQFNRDADADLGFGVALTVKDREPSAGAIRTYGLPVSIGYGK